MSRVAENHGKGHYQIDQTVQFDINGETINVRERWFVEDEDNLRLEASGVGPLADKLRLTFVYNNGKRHFIDQNGIKKSVKIPEDFYETYLHFRRSKVIKPRLVSHKIVPSVTLKSESHRFSERNPIPHEESFVRLSRTGGAVTYFIGEPTPNASEKLNPGIWIEQDQFHLRRIRFPSGTEVQARGYQKHTRDAWFPGELEIGWSGQKAKIIVGKVSALAASKTTKELFDTSSMNFGKDPQVSSILPDEKIISGFYQSMR